MKQYKAQAIVLRAVNYGEADKILTLFCRQLGKIQAIAKGVRKPNSRKRGTVQVFTYGNFLIHRGKTLDTVIQCETVEYFPELRNDLTGFTYANYLLELVNRFIPEQEPNDQILLLLLTSLQLLSSRPAEIIVRIFELKLLHLLGYLPELANCVNCREKVETNPVFFSVHQGGLVCSQCGANQENLLRTNLGIIEMVKHLLNIDFRKIDILKVSERNQAEIKDICSNYIQFYLDKKLKSLDFLAYLND